MALKSASLRRSFGKDVRRALVATPTRRALTYGQWLAVFVAAVALGEFIPWWIWPLVLLLQLACLLWIGNRLADRDALAAIEHEAGASSG